MPTLTTFGEAGGCNRCGLSTSTAVSEYQRIMPIFTYPIM